MSIWDSLTRPHPSITEQNKRWQARLTAIMILTIMIGISLNFLVNGGLPLWLLIPIFTSYLISRTKYSKFATYITLATLLAAILFSVIEDGDYHRYTVFSNIAWLALSMLLASLLFSVKETAIIAALHIIVVLVIGWLVPEMDIRSVGVSAGFLWMFSALLIAIMVQRNWLEGVRQQEIHLQATALESSDYAVMIVNKQREIIWINPAFIKLTGFTLETIYSHDLPFINHPAPNEQLASQIWDTLDRGQTWEGVVNNYRQTGEQYDESMIITPVMTDKGEVSHYVSIKHDITEQIAGEEQLKFLATHDLLTSLPNRGLFHDRLEQAIARAKRNNEIGALIYLDLDNFKQINDAYSHEDGDKVLMILAQRMVALTRETDTVARLSGDEFVIVMEDVKDRQNVALLTGRILYDLSKPIQLQHNSVTVSASMGITLFPEDGEEIAPLLQNADVAMYQGKSRGKNSFVFFEDTMKEDAMRRVSLGRDLRSAIANSELYLEYQPLIDLRSDKIIGAEALVRWQHPEQGKIYPNVFIPLAEDNNLIVPIGEWVLENAVSLFQDPARPALNNLRISINLSGQQLGSDKHFRVLADLIRTTNINPSLIQLEITETNIFENVELTTHELNRLKSLGVRLAIDDFGTGYSSLSYLEQFPTDVIKIDISFIRRITHKGINLPILNGIIAIAHEMGLEVIAEGVETQTQLDYLREHGCHLVQGYLLHKPMSQKDFLETIRSQ